jgi:hypothetical protein
MEEEIVKYYLSLTDDDDAEAKTCAKFDIDSDTLMFVLEADLVDSFMDFL